MERAEGHHSHKGRSQSVSLVGDGSEEILWQMWHPDIFPPQRYFDSPTLLASMMGYEGLLARCSEGLLP